MKNEKIHNLLESKRTEFSDILDSDTLTKVLKHLDGTKNLKEKELAEVFISVRNATVKKTAYEAIKTAVVYAPFFFVPLFGSSMGPLAYNILFAALSVINIAFNLDYKNRNVPMSVEEEVIDDINEHLKVYSKEYKNIQAKEEPIEEKMSAISNCFKYAFKKNIKSLKNAFNAEPALLPA